MSNRCKRGRDITRMDMARGSRAARRGIQAVGETRIASAEDAA
jgi:hypothetical protein